MQVLLNGAAGYMGQVVQRMLREGVRGGCLAAGIDREGGEYLSNLNEYYGEADVIIDFSHHSAAPLLAQYAVSRRLPLVVATTGHSDEELAVLRAAGESVPVFLSANMSMGVALLVELAKKTALCFPEADIEIVECHHNRKLDAPSGTAVLLFNALKEVRPEAVAVEGRAGHHKREKNEIGIHALRLGNETGTHEVYFSTGTQTVTLRHEAETRDIFAEGALAAAEYLCKKAPGVYNMHDMLTI